MDLQFTCKGAKTDSHKPYTDLFNYDGEPTKDIIKSNLVNYIVDYRDDFMDDIAARRKAHRNSSLNDFDDITGEGSARIDIEGERFEIELSRNPDIPLYAPVRVSSHEAVNHGSHGIIEETAPHVDTWAVRMLEGGVVHYQRGELADLSDCTTVDGKFDTELAVEARFDIGEYVLRNASDDYEDRVVQITARRYTPSMVEAPWSYWCRDVETGLTNLHAGERVLSRLPRNLQNLTIIQRAG